jgi:hypothetical protein
MLNSSLHSWTIETSEKTQLMPWKEGQLSLQIEQDSESVRINVSDSGNRIHKTILKLYLNPVYN